MYLIDTNVISDMRKGRRADRGVRRFFEAAIRDRADVFLSVVTIGKLRRGIDLIRHRGDGPRTSRLEQWIRTLLEDYAGRLCWKTMLEDYAGRLCRLHT